MTKQEDIKLKAYRLFCQHCQALQKTMGWKGKPCWVIQYNEPEAICASAIDAVDGLFNYLHSQGVVRKVDRELPSIFDINEDCISALEYRKKLAGYEAVEPLIEEK